MKIGRPKKRDVKNDSKGNQLFQSEAVIRASSNLPAADKDQEDKVKTLKHELKQKRREIEQLYTDNKAL